MTEAEKAMLVIIKIYIMFILLRKYLNDLRAVFVSKYYRVITNLLRDRKLCEKKCAKYKVVKRNYLQREIFQLHHLLNLPIVI